MEILEDLKEAVKVRGNLSRIASGGGLRPSAVSQLATGKNENPTVATLKKLREGLDSLTQPTPARASRTRAAATPKPTPKSSHAGRSKSRGRAGVAAK